MPKTQHINLPKIEVYTKKNIKRNVRILPNLLFMNAYINNFYKINNILHTFKKTKYA